jgi:hypothetical protein
MTDVPEVSRVGKLHGLLHLVAGYAPAEALTAMRADLAAGREPEVAAGIVNVVSDRRLPLSPADRAVLAGIVPDNPRLPLLAQHESGQLPGLMYRFQAALPAPEVFKGQVPPVLDLTSAPDLWVQACLDDVDRAVVQATELTAGAVALFRSWRYAPPVPPSRVYLLEADVPIAELAALTAQIQQVLTERGQSDPQVEVYSPESALPPYQRTARGAAALLWTADNDAPTVRLSRVFDRADADEGPQFDAHHPRMSGTEVDLVAGYLDDGSPLLTTTERMLDVVDPQRGRIVPMNYLTDGRWVWTDTVSYYLRVHALRPDPELLEHMRAVGFAMPQVDAVAAHRAMASLYLPAEPVWVI